MISRFLPAVRFLAVVLSMACSAVRGAPETVAFDGNAAQPAGGLVVQLGASALDVPIGLSRTGRHLVHVLDLDATVVAAAQARVRATGCYGLVSIERLADPARLPYTENLVNHVIVSGFGVSAAELFRVVAPNGSVRVTGSVGPAEPALAQAGFRVVSDDAAGLLAHKPWPASMDGWSHPRHAANGNAVSRDTAVSPPERIRWVAGAVEEVEGVVSAAGRNFYGGVLARDSFNGLRLWHRDLGKAAHNIGSFRLPRLGSNRARPIASARWVFAVEKSRLVALDAATGAVSHTFPGIAAPREVASVADMVVACDATGVFAFRAATGELAWRHQAKGVRNLVADAETVAFIRAGQSEPPRAEAVALTLASGETRWWRTDYPWLAKTVRTVLHGGYLACEVSSLTDHDKGNALHVIHAATGEPAWEKAYPPGMNHNRQARAMFVDDTLWILHGGRVNTIDRDNTKHLPIQVQALDPATGQVKATYPAGLAHCFPPVATVNYMLSGVMDLTNLRTGELNVNPITKANCSRENGWVPANGLIYTTPKHCTCWPILRGYVALAPAPPVPAGDAAFALERGPARPDPDAARTTAADWPLYRHDRWRSASTTTPGPSTLAVKWTRPLGWATPLPDGPIPHDWRENEFVKGPVSAPTVAGGFVYVARPDAHEVVAVDTANGHVRWRFTADGRVDLPPAIHRGLCIFGSHAGSVYALRADTGARVWRLQAAPTDERIVAYGQVESPWPVAGAVLVIDDTVYFAAGRQPLADGGILVFAVDPLTGRRLWMHRLDTIPQKGFYENSGLEFDPIDILHQEGDDIALSRWIIARDGKDLRVDKWNAFAKLDTGGGAVWVPRGCWTYGPRHQDRFRGEAPRRPLCAFRDHRVLSSFNGSTELFRRDFAIEDGETFNSKWITGWEANQRGNKGGTPFRTYRLAEKSTWRADPFTPAEKREKRVPGAQLRNEVYGMALAGDGRLFAVHKDGRLKVVAVVDGSTLAELQTGPPAWDSLAIAGRRLYLVTRAGELVCVGE